MRFRVVRQTTSLALTHGASVTTVSTAAASATAGLPLNGLLQGLVMTTPSAVDGSATCTINLIDQDGNTVYTKGSLAVNTTTQINLTPNAVAAASAQAIPLSGNYQIQAVFSASQTATDSTTKVVLLIDEG